MLYACVALVSAMVGLAIGNTPVPPPDNVVLVLTGFRHGNRNPGEFLKDDPNKGKWGLEGEVQLTNIGKKEAYTYGTFLRQRYDHLISKEYFPTQVKAQSSSAERCQMTTQSVLAGLFPPTGFNVWDPAIKWQPTAVAINDPLLRMYSVPNCPNSDAAWKPINDVATPDAKNLFGPNKDVIEYVANVTGGKPTLSHMADVFDNLEAMHLRHLKLPEWVSKNKFNRDIYKDVEKFKEANLILCGKWEPCRKMMAGYWLQDIVDNIQKFQQGKNETKLYVYGTHNEIVTSLFWGVGVKKEGVYYNGAALFEFRQKPSAAVRLFYSSPKEGDPSVRETAVEKMPFCDNQEWCPLDKFLAGVQPMLIKDWEDACRRGKCSCTCTKP